MYAASLAGDDAVEMPRLKGMFPFDVSRDGSELLLGHFSAGTAWGPYALWVSSVLGSGLRRLGNLEADTACWSPDGKEIGYNSGNGILVANADGTGSQTSPMRRLPERFVLVAGFAAIQGHCLRQSKPGDFGNLTQ